MGDNVLVFGNGGREHALLWKLAQSSHIDQLFYTGPNAGMAQVVSQSGKKAQLVTFDKYDSAAQWAVKNKIALTVVGPEAPLVAGIVDLFALYDLKCFGPNKDAAQLEGSKVFTKDFLARHNVPTAAYSTFDDADIAKDYIRSEGAPIVVKADGLAGGKGAIVCHTLDEAIEAIDKIMIDKAFKDAGDKIVVEEFMEGEEASILAFTDGSEFLTLVPTQDHKPAYDNDQGPNTGGMGAYGPAPVVTPEVMKLVNEKILARTIDGMMDEGMPFKGCLYAGLMIDKQGNPRIVEYNIRLGDPEAQPTLMQTKTDIYPIMQACASANLRGHEIENHDGVACCVVLASEGYPGDYEKGKIITGLEDVTDDNVFVFHAGTNEVDKNIITTGGRVLGVTGQGRSYGEAIVRAYASADMVRFGGEVPQMRRDIGKKALMRGE